MVAGKVGSITNSKLDKCTYICINTLLDINFYYSINNLLKSIALVCI